MPRIKPFRGLRYNLAQVGALGDVICSTATSAASNPTPFNVSRLMPSPTSEVDAEHAGRLFRQWVSSGVLQHEPDPAIYVYHQIRSSQNKPDHTLRGFIANVELSTICVPNEASEAQVTQELEMLRAVEANLSPLLGLYPDSTNEIQNLLEASIVGIAALEAVDSSGTRHCLWPVSDQATLADLASLLEGLPLIAPVEDAARIHASRRYALELQETQTLPADHACHSATVMLASTHEPGLVLAPSIRFVPDTNELGVADIQAAFQSALDFETVGHGAEAGRTVLQHLDDLQDQTAYGIYAPQDDTWLFATEKIDLSAQLPDSMPRETIRMAWVKLDQIVLPQLLETGSQDTAPTAAARVSSLPVEELEEVIRSRQGVIAIAQPPASDALLGLMQDTSLMDADALLRKNRVPAGLVINAL